MKTIYKYPIAPFHGIQEIKLPMGSVMLSVIEQNGEIMLYCSIANPEAGKVTYRYMVVGTGWELDVKQDDFPDFIGTVKCGSFVWHVFEVNDLPF